MTRCKICSGFLAHSFITYNGIDVYRCGQEDAWNDKGRYFIQTSAGLIEVEPQVHSSSKRERTWTFEIVDTERRRLKEESDRINEELDKRTKLYRSNIAEIERRQAERRRHEKLAGEDDEVS